MPPRFLKGITSLEPEEQFLNGGALLTILGIFLPWIGGEWLGGETVTYSGFRFFTSFLGIALFFLQLFLLSIIAVPLMGGPVIIKKRYREVVRFFVAAISSMLVLATLSVLMKVTFEFTRMEVRFGIYVSLIGSIVTLVYAFLRLQEQRKSLVQELFHHPEDQKPPEEQKEIFIAPPPPPPPPAPEPEEHRLYP